MHEGGGSQVGSNKLVELKKKKKKISISLRSVIETLLASVGGVMFI